MFSKSLILPTHNLNGTHPDKLIEQYTDVASAAYDLLAAMTKALPLGRDYPPSEIDGERQDTEARDAWRERMAVIRQISDEADAIAIDIHRQASNTPLVIDEGSLGWQPPGSRWAVSRVRPNKEPEYCCFDQLGRVQRFTTNVNEATTFHSEASAIYLIDQLLLNKAGWHSRRV